MGDATFLLQRFEAERDRLRGLAFRMLGSAVEADDVVQEAWIRMQSAEGATIENAGGWLTTVVSRLAIDVLRTRRRRKETAFDPVAAETRPEARGAGDPERDLLLADAVGVAMLVVLDRLRPPERVAFVLHDLFAVPFGDIARMLGCSPEAARQLASRARRTVRRGDEDAAPIESARKRELVQAFFAASRAGDFTALLRLLDREVVLTVDPALTGADAPTVARGPETVARRARRGAAQNRDARVMLIDGQPGIVIAPAGRLAFVMTFAVADERITGIEIVADPRRLERLDLAILDVD